MKPFPSLIAEAVHYLAGGLCRRPGVGFQRPGRQERRAAVDDAHSGSSMAAAPGTLRAIPTSKEMR
jgi:hypothetical protein